MNSTEWTGTLWLGRDYALIHGELGRTAPHAHYAHQVILAPEAPVTLLIEDQPRSGHEFFIEAQRGHAILQAPGRSFSLYAEPLSLDLSRLQQALSQVEWSLPALEGALRQCPRRPVEDPRIARALLALEHSLDGKVSADTLARAANLSLSQLERLFASRIGLPIRRLVLWRRLRLALAQVLAGHSLTAAAHEAGFADSAHFSRTMKKLFGVTAARSLNRIQLRLLD
ncbi:MULTISPECIES: helix-turn-helix domain-containing protein [Pseudomonas]|uniref:Helix-turn-helix transcriptional regulator n=1 Tax=Pseudomonas gingeri TaxID=117681 RepID=A0A7Y8BNK6_9PSED|nr:MULTISPECIES: AraC family transcriptional regulator [unclassified Pseudomonas]MCU1739790.1 AraC family transcriptional regulator [Pseudomonas sp. 20S_6.2_Bac1]NWB50280.1 helix-turn-helix transcriptional regulator [Pseudomonas gingeri]